MCAIYNVAPIRGSSPRYAERTPRVPIGGSAGGRGGGGTESETGASGRGVLKILSRRASETNARTPCAVSRDNWDTVYYRLRAIYAVRGV